MIERSENWRGEQVAVVPEPVCPFCGGSVEVVAFQKAYESDEQWERQRSRRDRTEAEPVNGPESP